MGPFVPDMITDELNLIVGLLIGVAFGFVLEQAGFSSSRKLTGLFYGTDFTVLRVFFSAGVTAMIGVFLLSMLGLLDTSIIFVHPMYIYAAVIGGAIMGVGFVVGGYCPGTAFCGAAIGKIDAIMFILGGMLGVLLFGESFPLVERLYYAGSFGDVTAFSLLGITPGMFGLLLILVAVGAFVATTQIEQKVNPSSPARDFPRRAHRLAALGVVLLGLVFAILPEREARLTGKASSQSYQQEHPVPRMTADELAFRILDQDPSLQLIDTRDPTEFAKAGLPGAVNIQVADMFGRQWQEVLGTPAKKTVFFDEDESKAVTVATLANLLGYENVAVLQGGLEEFTATILNVSTSESELTGTEQDTYRFRLKAAPRLATLIKERGRVEPVQKRVKKVVGGCGL